VSKSKGLNLVSLREIRFSGFVTESDSAQPNQIRALQRRLRSAVDGR